MKAGLENWTSARRTRTCANVARLVVAMLIGVTAGFTVLGATQRPASADHFDLQADDLLVTTGSAVVRHLRPGDPALDDTHVTGAPATSGTTPPESVQIGVCIDPNTNDFYVVNTNDNSVSKFDAAGNLLAHPFNVVAITLPVDCTVDTGGNLYVSNGTDRHVARLDQSTGGLLKDFAPPVLSPDGLEFIDLSHDDCTLYYTLTDNLVRRYNVCTDSPMAALPAVPDVVSPPKPRDCYGVSTTEPAFDHVLVACGDSVWKSNTQPSRRYA